MRFNAIIFRLDDDLGGFGSQNPGFNDFQGFSIFQHFDRLFADMNDMFSQFESATIHGKLMKYIHTLVQLYCIDHQSHATVCHTLLISSKGSCNNVACNCIALQETLKIIFPEFNIVTKIEKKIVIDRFIGP